MRLLTNNPRKFVETERALRREVGLSDVFEREVRDGGARAVELRVAHALVLDRDRALEQSVLDDDGLERELLDGARAGRQLPALSAARIQLEPPALLHVVDPRVREAHETRVHETRVQREGRFDVRDAGAVHAVRSPSKLERRRIAESPMSGAFGCPCFERIARRGARRLPAALQREVGREHRLRHRAAATGQSPTTGDRRARIGP